MVPLQGLAEYPAHSINEIRNRRKESRNQENLQVLILSREVTQSTRYQEAKLRKTNSKHNKKLVGI
jgi:hypothetical protein